MRTYTRLTVLVIFFLAGRVLGNDKASPVEALQQDDLKPKAVLEFKGVKITEDVKLYDEDKLGKAWDSKPDLLYKGKTGKWELNVVSDIASLVLRNARGDLLFKSDPVKLEGQGEPLRRAVGVEFKGILTDHAKDGRLYRDTESQSHVVVVKVKDVAR